MFNNFIKEFKAFVARGSTIDMAVGIVVGSTITSVINTFVKDIIMPPIGLLVGGIDFSNFFMILKGDGVYSTLAAAQAAGATTLNLGLFINSLVSFAITMFGIFLFVRAANKVREKHAGARTCPYCKMTNVSSEAVKCPYCCSTLIPKKIKDTDGLVEKVVLNTVKVTAKTLGKTTETLGKTTKKINKEISKNIGKIKKVIS